MLEDKVEAFLKRKKLHLGQARCLVGVSGGPDSLALLHFLWRRAAKYELTVTVAHLDHMFRGAESASEARFVQTFCEERNIPVFVKAVDVRTYMDKTGTSAQVAARTCRYEFYKEIMERERLDTLLLGHHGDDQIETMLMRLTRGSTGKARMGIPVEREFAGKRLIRPLLVVTKSEIEEYCLRHELQPVFDSSNSSDKYSRNRFRQQVLPFLKQENRNVHEHFQRFSEELEEIECFLDDLSAKKFEQVTLDKNEGKITIDIPMLTGLPMPLQRRVIKLILNYLYQSQPASLSAVHIDQILTVLTSKEPSLHLDLPLGLQVDRSYGVLNLGYEYKPPKPLLSTELHPGVNQLTNGDTLIWEYVEGEIEYTNMNQLLLPNDPQFLPLQVRTRMEGDRMSVKGMKGTKKIKDIFINEKVPVALRQNWPLVNDSSGRIIWIPGIRKSDLPDWNQMSNGQYIFLQYKKQ